MQWLRDALGVIGTAAETEGLARSLDGNDGVYLVPAFTGLGSPHWDPYARGTIVGLTRGTGTAHLARAALEATAYQTLDAVRAMESASGVRLEELKADGGAVQNTWLMQFQADVLGVPVVVPEVSETTALGAAYLAGVATGDGRRRTCVDVARGGALRARHGGVRARRLLAAGGRRSPARGDGRWRATPRRNRGERGYEPKMAKVNPKDMKPQVYKDTIPEMLREKYHRSARGPGWMYDVVRVILTIPTLLIYRTRAIGVENIHRPDRRS